MKKIFTLSVAVLLMFAAFTTTSCSSEKSAAKAFKTNGYVMGELDPAQQAAQLSIMNNFPMYSQTALGYIVAGNSITFVYDLDDVSWNMYTQELRNEGFSNVSNGFVKADKSKGVTYNVSTKTATIYKNDYRLVTFACVRL